MASFPTPTYTPGTLGNGLNAVSLAHGATIACLIDATQVLAVAMHCQILTGATPITTAVTFNCYRVPGQTATSPQTTLAAGASAGATSLSVASAIGIGTKCIIGLVSASNPSLAEIVTVTAISGTTLTVNAITNAYSSGAYVFLIEQTPSGFTTAPGISWAANTEYSSSQYPGALWLYLVGVTNGDSSNAATVTITYDTSK